MKNFSKLSTQIVRCLPKEVTDSSAERLQAYLTQASKNQSFSYDNFREILQVADPLVEQAIKSLLGIELLISMLECNVCGYRVYAKELDDCSNCGSENTNLIFLVNTKLLDAGRTRHEKWLEINELEGRLLLEHWNKRGEFFYLALDIHESQRKQGYEANGDRDPEKEETYDLFRRECFYQYIPAALSYSQIRKVNFGDVGDLIKLGFFSAEDALKGLKVFLKHLYGVHDIRLKYKSILDNAGHIKFGVILKPIDRSHVLNPERLFKKAPNEGWDLNAIDVTHLFRNDAASKYPENIYFESWLAAIHIYRDIVYNINMLPPPINFVSLRNSKDEGGVTEEYARYYIDLNANFVPY